MSAARLPLQVARLGVADFRFEGGMSFCFVAALAGVLTPLIILLALKYGFIDALTQRLTGDPRNLEVTPVGAGRYDAAWFAAMADDDAVGFVIPRTRQIAATADLAFAGANGAAVVTAELIPTAAGDPLIALSGTPPPAPGEVLLSDRAARELGAAAGDAVDLIVVRTRDGGREVARRSFVVAAVLPPDAFGRPAAFVDLSVLLAAEDFRDGRAVPDWGFADDPPPPEPRLFASFRLYAADLDAVAALEDRLVAAGGDVRTRAADIAAVQRLDASLSVLFLIVVALGGTGFLVSMGASLWANVARKQKALSVIHLLGAPRRALALFPLTHAALIAVIGGVASALAALAVSAVINAVFADQVAGTEQVCRLVWWHVALALAATLVLALAAAALAAWRVLRIAPAEGLRDV
ncbi:MAG: FtsX-like permease family protein [Alphaproteobacteria bacterium]